MEETGWLPSTAEIVDQDVADALAIHEAVVAGFRRLRRMAEELPRGPSPERVSGQRQSVPERQCVGF